MSAKEIYAGGAEGEDDGEGRRRSGRRFVLVLTVSMLLLFALTVGSLYVLFSGKLRLGIALLTFCKVGLE